MGEKLLFFLLSFLNKTHPVPIPSLDHSTGGKDFLGCIDPIGPVPYIICRKEGNSCSAHQCWSCSGVRRFLILIRYSMTFSSCLDRSSEISKYLTRRDSIFMDGLMRSSRSSKSFVKSSTRGGCVS